MQQTILTLIGVLISEATVLNYVMQLDRALEAWDQSALERLLDKPAMHVDETSFPYASTEKTTGSMSARRAG